MAADQVLLPYMMQLFPLHSNPRERRVVVLVLAAAAAAGNTPQVPLA